MEVYEAFISLFNQLPLAALINGSCLCISGGLSPEVHELTDIQCTPRFMEPPPYGPLCDLLWSAPMANFNEQKRNCKLSFVDNNDAGRSFCFSVAVVTKFFQRNNIKQMIRSGHTAFSESGFLRYQGEMIINVFSAANHCGEKNDGSVIKFGLDKKAPITVQCYKEFEQPFQLPGGLNALTWTMPVALELVVQILKCLTRQACQQTDGEIDIEQSWTESRRQRIWDKIYQMNNAIAFLHSVHEQHMEAMLQAAGVKKASEEPSEQRLVEIQRTTNESEMKNVLSPNSTQHEYIWLHEQEWSDNEGIAVPAADDGDEDDDGYIPAMTKEAMDRTLAMF